MEHQNLQVGTPLKILVHWYDKVCEPAKNEEHQGEVVGWRASQVIVRVAQYAVIRFWKRNGLEVGNGDAARRGFRVDLAELAQSVAPGQPDGQGIPIAMDTDA